MKLLELLVQEKVQWPEGALWAVQDFDKELKFDEVDEPPTRPMHSCSGEVWYRNGHQNFDNQYLAVRASDWATKAVSKSEYDAAVVANAEWVPVKWGDWEVGDELRFCGYTPQGESHTHWGWVIGSVYRVVALRDMPDVYGPTNGRSIASADWGFKFSKRKPSATPAVVPPAVVTTAVRDWYAELVPIIVAAAEGKVVQCLSSDGSWSDSAGAFTSLCKYRVKPEEPKTIKVNGFDVPEPMRDEPAENATYAVAQPSEGDYYNEFSWGGCPLETNWLQRGLLHSTKEAAVAHAKAMLGIDPYATEDADDEHA